MKLDKGTFGKGKVAETLCLILEEVGSDKDVAKVSSFLSRMNILTRDCMNISNTRTKRIIGQLLINEINGSTLDLPCKVKSHMKNLAITRVKMMLRD